MIDVETPTGTDMSRPPYFPLYVLDFTGDPKVEAMSTTAVGAYILLLCKAWHQDPPATLPNHDPTLARYARLTMDEWAGVKPDVLTAFTLGSDDRLHQKRLRREYENVMRRFKASRANGRHGGRPKKTQTEPKANLEETHRFSHAGSGYGSGSPPESVQGESAERGGGSVHGLSGRFPAHHLASVLAAYPKRVKHRKASAALDRALCLIADGPDPPADPLAWMLERVQAFAASPKAKGPYVPDPHNFFDDGSYNDDPEQWQRDGRAGAGTSGGAAARAAQQRADRRAGEFPEDIAIPIRTYPRD